MGRQRLQRFADDLSAATPAAFEELAHVCWDLAVNELDVRFMVLRECFVVAASFWGDGEAGAVSASFRSALDRAWRSYLPGILAVRDETEGVALALALLDEFAALGASDPLQFRD